MQSSMENANIKLIIGLGNPGEEYEQTFHNIGKLFITYAAREDKQFSKDAGINFIKDDGLVLAFIDSYMNESGEKVKEALKKFNAKPEELLVVHDDSDLPLGTFKISFDAGSAGHKGISSIISNLGTNSFWRARIGIRKEKGKAGDFVLRNIPEEDMNIFYGVFGDLKLKVAEKTNP